VKEFMVVWRIEIEAETPEEAAREALKIQRDPTSQTTHFEVSWREANIDKLGEIGTRAPDHKMNVDAGALDPS